MTLILIFFLLNLRFSLLQKVAACKFLRFKLLLLRCEIQLSFWLKNFLINVHIIKYIFIGGTWKEYGIFKGDRAFFWYKSIEDLVLNEVILCVLNNFIIARWIAGYLVTFLFNHLFVADVKVAQHVAWNRFEWLGFVPFLTQVFIIFFFCYLFILDFFHFLCTFNDFKILQELLIIIWDLVLLNILVKVWFLIHILFLQLFPFKVITVLLL